MSPNFGHIYVFGFIDVLIRFGGQRAMSQQAARRIASILFTYFSLLEITLMLKLALYSTRDNMMVLSSRQVSVPRLYYCTVFRDKHTPVGDGWMNIGVFRLLKYVRVG